MNFNALLVLLSGQVVPLMVLGNHIQLVKGTPGKHRMAVILALDLLVNQETDLEEDA